MELLLLNYINCLVLYFVCKCLLLFLLTRANFVIGFWTVKFARK
jgi:hypothetical protein